MLALPPATASRSFAARPSGPKVSEPGSSVFTSPPRTLPEPASVNLWPAPSRLSTPSPVHRKGAPACPAALNR